MRRLPLVEVILLASATAAAPLAQPPNDRYGLKWDQFTASPARTKIDGCRLVDELDVLALYYGLNGGQYPVAEFAAYSEKYRSARDEFERRKIEPQVVEKLRDGYQVLTQSSLCAKITDVPIGDYDFARKGFPLTHHGGVLGTRQDVPGMKAFAVVADHTASADAVVNQANALAKMQSSPYRWKTINASIDFVNEKDASLFPAFVAVDEDLAHRATSEFGSFVDEDAKAVAQTLGSEYKPERTVSAYVLLSPKSAATEDSTLFGVDFKLKVIRAQALSVVLATDKGTVLAVLQPTRQKRAREHPAQTVAKHPVAPSVKKNASDMSLDELSQYLKRSKDNQ